MKVTGMPAGTPMSGLHRAAKPGPFQVSLSAIAGGASKLQRAADSLRDSAALALNFPSLDDPSDDLSESAAVKLASVILAPAAKSLLLVALATLVIFALRGA